MELQGAGTPGGGWAVKAGRAVQTDIYQLHNAIKGQGATHELSTMGYRPRYSVSHSLQPEWRVCL